MVIVGPGVLQRADRDAVLQKVRRSRRCRGLMCMHPFVARAGAWRGCPGAQTSRLSPPHPSRRKHSSHQHGGLWPCRATQHPFSLPRRLHPMPPRRCTSWLRRRRWCGRAGTGSTSCTTPPRASPPSTSASCPPPAPAPARVSRRRGRAQPGRWRAGGQPALLSQPAWGAAPRSRALPLRS